MRVKSEKYKNRYRHEYTRKVDTRGRRKTDEQKVGDALDSFFFEAAFTVNEKKRCSSRISGKSS